MECRIFNVAVVGPLDTPDGYRSTEAVCSISGGAVRGMSTADAQRQFYSSTNCEINSLCLSSAGRQIPSFSAVFYSWADQITPA